MFLMLYSIKWPNFFVWLPLLLEILGNMWIAIGFNKVVKKFTKICLRPERAPLKTHAFLFWHNTLYQIWCVTASIVVFKLTCGKLLEAHQCGSLFSTSQITFMIWTIKVKRYKLSNLILLIQLIIQNDGLLKNVLNR